MEDKNTIKRVIKYKGFTEEDFPAQLLRHQGEIIMLDKEEALKDKFYLKGIGEFSSSYLVSVDMVENLLKDMEVLTIPEVVKNILGFTSIQLKKCYLEILTNGGSSRQY